MGIPIHYDLPLVYTAARKFFQWVEAIMTEIFSINSGQQLTLYT